MARYTVTREVGKDGKTYRIAEWLTAYAVQVLRAKRYYTLAMYPTYAEARKYYEKKIK